MKVLAKEIEMLASFQRRGQIRPHRFRVAGEDGREEVIQVEKILQTEETRLAGVRALVFTCQSVIRGLQRRYELKYRVEEHRWELYKM
ncbi:MAG: hypothetical protein LBR14_00225 [Clostridiales Family XIII bacterium]|nr:hypothetical protein [Clostridiales Family XIII bacterium]